MQIVDRAVIGVPAPGGRALLASKTIPLLVHYTGVDGYSDPKRDYEYASGVARYGISAGKPFEYNYLIGSGGTVFEQAGAYRGAHCLNFNAQSYGVLFMLGKNIAPSDSQVASFHDLRDYLMASGQLHTAHFVAPHYRYRSTACPGNTLADVPGARWNSPTGEGSLGQLKSFLIIRTTTSRPTIGVGANPLVVAIQIILNERANQGLVIDGNFGVVTANAWNNLCTFMGWPVDSEVSGKDWDLLAYLDGGWDRLVYCGFPKSAI